jgi:protein arginine kinase activator
MNCENCGKEEVSFHYTSNINGNITEKHLCAECAGKLGYTGGERNMLRPDISIEDVFTEMFGGRPSRRVIGGYPMVFPTFVIPTIGFVVPEEAGAQPERRLHPQVQPSVTPQDIKPEIDEEMKKRREINVLREQMRTAAETEDFEKAAALRDSIRRLENGENI